MHHSGGSSVLLALFLCNYWSALTTTTKNTQVLKLNHTMAHAPALSVSGVMERGGTSVFGIRGTILVGVESCELLPNLGYNDGEGGQHLKSAVILVCFMARCSERALPTTIVGGRLRNC
jgi:hypothetical protein